MKRFSIDRKEGNYIMMYRIPFQDKELSLKARGLLATIMAFPPDWEFSVKGLTTIIREGKSSVYNTINELIESGYCNRVVRRDSEGRVLGTDYIFADFPKFAPTDTSNPFPENRDTENQYTENRTQYNTQSNKINKIDRESVLAEKREKLKNACVKYIPQYGEAMVGDFVRYWSEAADDNSVLLKCEIAKRKSGCFEINRRLATWASKGYNQKETTPQASTPKKSKWEEMGMTEEEYNQLINKL